jgi:hypothetical protein
VVGRATAVLTRRRLAALGVLAAVLAAYFAGHESLPDVSTWWDVAFIALLVIPGVFAPVWLLLPLRDWRWRWLAILVCIALAVVFSVLGWEGPASFSKLGAATFAGWLFLDFFEEASWVVLVALIIPWVDAYSVWRGPTNTITQKHEHFFFSLSFEFPVPGSNAGARLGLPDLLFFALYLGAAARWNLRTGWTWVCLTASLSGTLALATWPWLGVSGLPALPLLSVGFLLPNADLLWRAVRDRGARDPHRSPT